MIRAVWICLFVFVGWVSRVGGAETRPNYIFILADDLGWADLGCYGSRYYRTPNIDRLATEGMRFTDAYAAAPVCSPTRAAILTGRCPVRYQLTDWLPGRTDRPEQKLARPQLRLQLPLEERTLAEALQQAGYSTGHIGKWHLGGEGFGPTAQGFQLNVAGDDAGSPRSYFAPYRGRARDGREVGMIGLEQAPDGEYLTDRLTSEAIRFVETNREKPFFLYLAHYGVHIPLRAKQEFVNHFPVVAGVGKQTNALYAAMIESLDEGVGRIVQRLEELKLTERTVVIFSSDNGGLATLEGPATPATINTPLREGKGYLYEGGIRVPLIMKSPGLVRPGSLCSTPVTSVDFFPTFLELSGLPADSALDGVSLVPLLKGENLSGRDLYWHYPHYSNQGGKPGAVIRSGGWKLIEFYENGRRELYDLSADAGESQNLADQEPARVTDLANRLESWRRSMQLQPLALNREYQPNLQLTNGAVLLPARWAEVHGRQLRYEPLPHKNTLGYWIRTEDWASWEFELREPGEFEVELLQGCGTGQGGSEIEIAVGDQRLTMVIEDTGHFQNFKRRSVGKMNLAKPGRYTLTVRPLSKAKAAVMDLREILLRPTREAP